MSRNRLPFRVRISRALPGVRDLWSMTCPGCRWGMELIMELPAAHDHASRHAAICPDLQRINADPSGWAFWVEAVS